nr:MAG TPA: hypothetical protein [Bacteriophage sp.]
MPKRRTSLVFEFLYLTSIIRSLIKIFIINMKKSKGTNYIDHRFSCLGMIKHIMNLKECMALIDVHGNLLYYIIYD